MFLVDSHCHLDQLDLTIYNNNLTEAMQVARDTGVQHILCVSITLTDFPKVLKIAEEYPDVSASCGLHPNESVEHEPTVAELVELAKPAKVVAIGETGLDYYRSKGDLTWQKDRFRRHIAAAKTLQKPLIIHSRAARADTLAIMREEEAGQVGGVMHCFTEDIAMAEAAMALGFYISFSGIVTFTNAKELQAVAKAVPLERMLIETDAPYLAPVPYRGQPNQPAYVRYTAEYLADLKGVSLDEFAEQTTANFFRVFNCPMSS